MSCHIRKLLIPETTPVYQSRVSAVRDGVNTPWVHSLAFVKYKIYTSFVILTTAVIRGAEAAAVVWRGGVGEGG